ncbi:hypothetical protein BDR03DRAFT_1007531 [Suillus americanus]|nr:hypothetical protein BDR03DRAFT_1007531 [Suillus americanus]
MGITELWKLVSPSTEGQTLTEFALEGLKGHVQDESSLSMMTVSVDASAWLYADRPTIKRSKQATAKGEAEADLASMPCYVFGAEKVLRLTDNEDGTFLVDAYCAEALSNNPTIPLTTSRLLLWAMLHGGDYNPGGLSGCGGQVSRALLAGDLSDSLMQVVTSVAPAQLPGMLETWCDCLHTFLVDGTLGRKYPTLTASIPAEFPSVKIMRLYLHPVTTWTDGASSSLLPQFNPTQPNIVHLAAFCQARLGWMRPKIHKWAFSTPTVVSAHSKFQALDK